MNIFGKFFQRFVSLPTQKTFKYRKEVNVLGKTLYKPIATIYINHKDLTWHPYSMYIDSGADITTINKTFGNLIGLRLKPKEEKFLINGIGGKEEFVYRDIDIKIVRKVFNIKVAWIQNDNIPLLLGRENVFDRFEIVFKQNNREISFIEL